MSTDILNEFGAKSRRGNPLRFVRFWGGKENGVCLLISAERIGDPKESAGYIEITRKDAGKLADQLREFANGEEIEEQIFHLEAFISPLAESSILKGIPITYRYHPAIRRLLQRGYRVRYRGPRRKGEAGVRWSRIGHLGQLTCLKKDATSFAVYPPAGETKSEALTNFIVSVVS